MATGVVNAGGRPLETPFGTVYTTNITPDVDTGIGAWSYPAFERAMREGIHRDGRHLYPAFPYTHFARTNDADLQALIEATAEMEMADIDATFGRMS